MDSPITSRKDSLVLGEYALKNSVSEPFLPGTPGTGSEGGSFSDDDSSAEGTEDSLFQSGSVNLSVGRTIYCFIRRLLFEIYILSL
jgi:hypothetical protein